MLWDFRSFSADDDLRKLFVLDSVGGVQFPPDNLHILWRVNSQPELVAALIAFHECDVDVVSYHDAFPQVPSQ